MTLIHHTMVSIGLIKDKIGGISSYSTVLLIVAYMNYMGIRYSHGMSPSKLLMGFLNYYGNYFNQNSLGVSVYNDW